MINASYIKSISREFLEKSRKINSKVGHIDFKKINLIRDYLGKLDNSVKFFYNDVYNLDISSLSFNNNSEDLMFYEFNLNEFVFIIMKKGFDFYIFNNLDGKSRLVNRFYTLDPIRKSIKNIDIIEGDSIEDLSDIIITGNNPVAHDFYISSIISIMHDIENCVDFSFSYFDRISLETDDLLDVRVGGKTGFFISTKLIHGSYYESIARRSFFDNK